jgi:Flp pilus assembly protein TadD
MRVRAALVCLLALALGCSTVPRGPGREAITPGELLAGAPLGVPPDAPTLVAEGDVLALSAEMDSFLALHVDRSADDRNRLRQLARAIIGEGDFGLEYDDATHTAAETFRLRRGNCLSFSTMLVVMARRVGLDAYFQEVDVPPDWSAKEDAFLLNRHVNVLVDLGTSGDQVVDFSSEDFRASYDVRLISDERALAHFDNNLGVERMRSGDTPAALAYFGRALTHDRQFAPAWTNLGILYLRHGHPAHAEAAYLQALKADRFDHVAMSNLASLYERRGDLERAEAYRRQVIAHRNRNPYYRYELAREAYRSGDLDAAITHLRYAVRQRQEEDRFYYLLGLAYLQQGDTRAARRWLTRAVELAPDEATKREYSATRDTLLGGATHVSP